MDQKIIEAIKKYNCEWSFFVFMTHGNLHSAFSQKLKLKQEKTKDFAEQEIVNSPSVKNLEDEKSPDFNPINAEKSHSLRSVESQLTSEDGNKPKIWVETPAKRSVKRGMLHFMLVQPMSGRVESKEIFSSFEQRFDRWFAGLTLPMDKGYLVEAKSTQVWNFLKQEEYEGGGNYLDYIL